MEIKGRSLYSEQVKTNLCAVCHAFTFHVHVCVCVCVCVGGGGGGGGGSEKALCFS